MATYPRRASYGIFVRFRRSRLALRRGIIRLEDALSLAEQLRAGRFHDRGDIFVVKEPEGTIVELAPPSRGTPEPPSPPPQAAPPAPPGPSVPPTPRAPRQIPSQPVTPVTAEEPPRGPAFKPARDVTALLRLVAQAEHIHGAVARARAAQARFERACQDAEQALRSAGGTPPAALRRTHERLLELCGSAAQSVASFERVADLVQHRLDVAWAEATGHTSPAGARPRFAPDEGRRRADNLARDGGAVATSSRGQDGAPPRFPGARGFAPWHRLC